MYHLLKVQCEEGVTEILQVELAELGFDAFLEDEKGFECSIEKGQLAIDQLEALINRMKGLGDINYQLEEVEKQNWNRLWEANFPYTIVDDKVLIRAEFHQVEKSFPYELIITPKMSFGTGHHATTSMMVTHQLSLDFKGKKVLDVGCGTGILAIMAMKLGAQRAIGVDIEEWSVENTLENARNNQVPLEACQGTLQDQNFQEAFDILLANINKNIILQDLKHYEKKVISGGKILLSGILIEDIKEVREEAERLDLLFEKELTQDKWASLLFSKG
ncbi:50S ribosomal protein L11 methyltransferase [Rapidithrix thailandica]|uniref:Ribosomal protein L11 methyltransferase n=1 Tax=Rapidithrix thailandica TaxID=413964 RepID=A0AAW9SBS1_9BACT